MILDTYAVSAFEDGEPGVGEVVRQAACAAIPIIVLGEFRRGMSQSRHRRASEAWLERYLPRFDVLTVDAETAIAYADLRVALRRAGRPIPANDAWIAALAIQHRMPILSRDEHFDAVPSLRRIEW